MCSGCAMDEPQTQSLTDELPVCDATGTGIVTNQLYREDGTQRELHQSYDHSFQCQQLDDGVCFYVICSGHQLSGFAKEKLAAELLFGQLQGAETPDDVKDVLRQAFDSFERDFTISMDELLIRTTQLQYQQNSHNEGSMYQGNYGTDDRLNNRIDITLALVYKTQLYVCNLGRSRAIICRTDENDVLKIIELAGCAAPSSRTVSDSLISSLEIVGPTQLDNSYRFLVLLSSGLCQTMDEIHSMDTNIVNREIVQIVVQQFRQKASLKIIAQSVVEKIASQHFALYLNAVQESPFKSRPDSTVMVRNFNYPMPNALQVPRNQINVTFNPSDSQSSSNGIYTPTEDEIRPAAQQADADERIDPYVGFGDYYKNVENARKRGDLPVDYQFD